MRQAGDGTSMRRCGSESLFHPVVLVRPAKQVALDHPPKHDCSITLQYVEKLHAKTAVTCDYARTIQRDRRANKDTNSR